MNKQSLLSWAFVYLVVVNVLDFITTSMMIEKDGYKTELNPILFSWMTQTNSVYPILLSKMVPLLLFAIALRILVTKEPQHINKLIGVMMVMNVGLTVIVGASTYCLI